MDHRLLSKVKNQLPQLNPRLAGGFSAEQLEISEQYLDDVINALSTSFPVGLKYEGSRRCSPLESAKIIRETTRCNKQNNCFDLSRTDAYLVEYKFSYKEPSGIINYIKKYIFLPHVHNGGFLYIRGSSFFISPVITDLTVSVEGKKVFIPIIMDKLIFSRTVYHVRKNGKNVPAYIIHSKLHHIKDEDRVNNRGGKNAERDPSWTLVHYILCRYGLKETFKRFLGLDIEVGESWINNETYPENKWTIFETTGIQPKTNKVKHLRPSKIKIAVPLRTDKIDETTMIFIGSVFYVIDHYPDWIEIDGINNSQIWKRALGMAIFQNWSNVTKLLEDVETHLDSLDLYIDEMTKKNLINDGINAESIHDLFLYIITNMTMLVLNTDTSSMYNKRLTVLRYVLFDIVKAFVNVNFVLRQSRTKELPFTEIKKIFDKNIYTELVFSIKKHTHAEVTTIETPGDNILQKAISKIVLQTKATPKQRAKSNQGNEMRNPSHFYHESINEVCSHMYQPKKSPDGRAHINLFAEIDSDNRIRRKEKFKERMDYIHPRIKRT